MERQNRVMTRVLAGVAGCWRRRAALWVVASVLAGCGRGSGAEPVLGMFRGGPEHTGTYAAPAGSAYGGIAWRFATRGPIRSSPVVVRDRVYVGSGDGAAYALDANTGALVWRTDLGSSADGSPAVTATRVFITTRLGRCFALDRATGRVVWEYQSGPPAKLAWGFESGDVYTSSPVPAGGLVVFGARDGYVHALDAAGGSERWRFRTGGRVVSSPAVSSNTVFAGSMDGSLYALRLESGEPLWRFDTQGHSLNSGDFGFDRRTIQSLPAVADGVVYFGAKDGNVYAVDAAGGQEKWHFSHDGSWAVTSPSVSDNVVFAGSSDAHFIQALAAPAGEETWHTPTSAAVWASPAVAGELVYFMETQGRLIAADRATGQARWTLQLPAPTMGSPVPAGNQLLVAARNDLYAIRLTRAPLQRAVFWDSTLLRQGWSSVHWELRDYLRDNGYQVLGTPGLLSFLAQRTADRAPSVIVFALDALPEAAADSTTRPLRNYLDAGGKVVWVGVPPLIWPRDPTTGAVSYDGINRAATEKLLGVNHSTAQFDRFGSLLTPAGEQWGLEGGWMADWAVPADAVTTPLALDENGNAVAWLKNYGGGPGTGFLRLPTSAAINHYDQVRAVAEAFPVTR